MAQANSHRSSVLAPDGCSSKPNFSFVPKSSFFWAEEDASRKENLGYYDPPSLRPIHSTSTTGSHLYTISLSHTHPFSLSLPKTNSSFFELHPLPKFPPTNPHTRFFFFLSLTHPHKHTPPSLIPTYLSLLPLSLSHTKIHLKVHSLSFFGAILHSNSNSDV